MAGFIGVRERPVAADMDQDGIDDIGLWVPDRAGATPEETAEWYFLISDDPEPIDGREIDGAQDIPMRFDERLPCGLPLPIWGGFDPVLLENVANGRVGYVVADVGEGTLDAVVTP